MSLDNESTFDFVTDQRGLRSFHHHYYSVLHISRLECSTCHSVCDVSECYSNHWPEPNEYEVLKINEKQRLILQKIPNIKVFLMRIENSALNGTQLINDASSNAVPQLLRLLFTDARELSVQVTLYVSIKKFRRRGELDIIYSSSKFNILHYYDVTETIDMLFEKFLDKINDFMFGMTYENSPYLVLPRFKVKRIRLEVEKIGSVDDGKLLLPAKYRVKLDPLASGNVALKSPAIRVDHSMTHGRLVLRAGGPTNQYQADRLSMFGVSERFKKMLTLVRTPENTELANITKIYRDYLSGGKNSMPLELSANLYAFRICHENRELFVTPQYLMHRGVVADGYKEMPSYIILNDVWGNFCQLAPIVNLKEFLKIDRQDTIWECRNCGTKHKNKARLELHKMTECKHILATITDSKKRETVEKVEIKNYVPLDMGDPLFIWSLYGVIEEKL